LLSCAVGVGHIRTAWLRFTLCIDPSFCWLLSNLSVKASEHVGVGQLPDGVLARVHAANPWPELLVGPDRFGPFQSFDCGVGKYPNPFPSVWSTGIVSSEHDPFRIVPDLGQVPEYSVKPPRSEHW